MAELTFFIAGLGAVAGAIGVVTVRNAFYSVLALVAHLICLSLLFLLLRAEFVAAAQVVVYAGAVMVLYVFVVAYIGGSDTPLGPTVSGRAKGFTALFGVALFAELAIAILGSGLKAIDSDGAPYSSGIGPAAKDAFGTPGAVGELLLTRFLLPFEVASFLLLIAAVGAVTLARRRGGLETAEELRAMTPLDLQRSSDTGTMAEAVGSRQRSLNATNRAPDPDREPERVGW